ncbi:3-oxoacyl-ACP synthase III family protein [Hymenobacter crusticola]|uniref:3-oxoacyl-ACP synthase n=1 Tax=Hymenobacter crusticola TaxID=1770526 RepID=A0A243WIP9_9BACT|nr:ketoacyl-ACP synthase III [Hymenobacter crusticola]OUJ74879.1 3-oxoacyl-ACP synthase [Hymenobacter crusticola]
MIRSVLVASGSCIPDLIVSNEDFSATRFFSATGTLIEQAPAITLERFQAITGIRERRYARPEQNASDLGWLAADETLLSSGIDRESLDYIIVAHNFGDVAEGSNRVDLVPSLASRIKARLGIQNPNCVAYDLAFGCPGWLEALIQANYYIRSGDARRCLVIGTETLSRVVDPHDRDTMLFSDGSGAVILEASTADNVGILAHHTQTYAYEYAGLLSMGKSYAPTQSESPDRFMKMQGRKLYEFALQHVPMVVKTALDKAQVPLTQVKKVLLHQANEKMDVAILQRLFQLYGEASPNLDLMPMTIGWLGNSSVATLPTLIDLLQKEQLADHRLEAGDLVVLASVGAGMNINAVVYQY